MAKNGLLCTGRVVCFYRGQWWVYVMSELPEQSIDPEKIQSYIEEMPCSREAADEWIDVDLFAPAPPTQKRPQPTRSETLEAFHAKQTYTQIRSYDQGESEYKARMFVPTADQEDMLSSLELSLSEWGDSYSKRRAIEKKTAAYIRNKVAPTGLMGNAIAIADRLDNCRLSGVLGMELNSGRKIIKWSDKCGLKNLCPDESRADQKRVARKYVPAVQKWLKENKRGQFQYAVFEPVNVALGDLKAGMKKAQADLNKLLRHKSFEHVKGVFSAMECPLSKDGKSWNVHINCLLLVDGHYDWKSVRDEYGQRIHFDGHNEILRKTSDYLQRRNGGVPVELSKADILVCAFREILKYSCKHVSSKTEAGRSDAPAITDWPPALFCEWYSAHYGFRRARSYGVLNQRSDDGKALFEGLDDLQPYDVQWIGSIDYDQADRRYQIAVTRRSSINSLQGDKSTKLRAKNSRQVDLYRSGAPPN